MEVGEKPDSRGFCGGRGEELYDALNGSGKWPHTHTHTTPVHTNGSIYVHTHTNTCPCNLTGQGKHTDTLRPRNTGHDTYVQTCLQADREIVKSTDWEKMSTHPPTNIPAGKHKA